MRVKVPGRTRDDDGHLHELAELFARIGCVERVQLNLNSGSIVVEYCAEEVKTFAEDTRHMLQERGESWVANLTRPLNTLVDVLQLAWADQRNADASQTLVRLFEALNVGVKRNTHNAVDLKLLLPLAAVAIGLLAPNRNKGSPLWLSLATFATNVLLVLHRPEPVRVEPVVRVVH